MFEFADGGRYCGEWSADKGADGHGVCTGPGDSGVFAGKWENGEQNSGVFTWASGHRYAGTWAQGMRDGVGEEVSFESSCFLHIIVNNGVMCVCCKSNNLAVREARHNH